MATVRLAESAGFCFGVNKAVDTVYRLLSEGKRVCTLGPIIHNPQVVEDMAARGVSIVSSPDEVPEGAVLVIRSHGVPAAVYDQTEELGLSVCDATCPFVSKIHRIVKERSRAGDTVLIAGDAAHPDVMAAVGALYADTLSQLRPRVMVQGNPHYLAQAGVVAEIRALLLAAVRSAMLWRQAGGNYWDFLFFRARMIAAVERALR